VEPGHNATHLRTELRGKRHGLGVDHGHFHAPRRSGGCNFRPDEAGADHGHPASGHQLGGEALCVREGAQGEDVTQSGQGGELPRPRAGGNDDAVRLDRSPVLKADGLRICFQGCSPGAQQPFGLQFVGVGLQEEVLGRARSEQEVLGQRGSVIRPVLFVADNHQPSGEALGAGRASGGKTGQGGSHNRKRLHIDILFQLLISQR
jgi:hypothetical protein